MSVYVEKKWIETHNPVTGSTPENLTVPSSETIPAPTPEEEDEEEYEENNMFESMFSDPDPYITTLHSFDFPQQQQQQQQASQTSSPKTPPPSMSSPTTIEIKLKGHKAELGQTLHSTGLTLWRAAPLLCSYLLSSPETISYIKGKFVLELGAGLGLIGILAACLRPKMLVVTDGDSDTLAGMRGNVELNRGLIGGFGRMGEGGENNIECAQLLWGENMEGFRDKFFGELGEGEERGFDTILGSDIIYVEEIIQPLFKTVDFLLKKKTTKIAKENGGITPPPTFLLGYARRNVKIDLVFVEAERMGFSWSQPDGPEGAFAFIRK